MYPEIVFSCRVETPPERYEYLCNPESQEDEFLISFNWEQLYLALLPLCRQSLGVCSQVEVSLLLQPGSFICNRSRERMRGDVGEEK